MATERQIEANQRNAQKSTGPRTEEGKESSRGNSYKHGMSADGPVATAQRTKMIADRKVMFTKELQPKTAFQTFLVHELAETSVRVNICETNLNKAFDRDAKRASYAWDDDRQLEVATLADKLSKKPELVSIKLKKTRHGCEFLVGRWGVLAGILVSQGGWNEELRSQALDMLGVEQMHRAGRTALDPVDGVDAIVHLQELVTDQVAKLSEKLTQYLIQDDENQQQDAIDGTHVFRSRDVQLIMRYRGTTLREMFKLLGEIRRKPSQGEKINQFSIDDLNEDLAELQTEPVPVPESPAPELPAIFHSFCKRPDEKLEDMTPARLSWLQALGQMPKGLTVPPPPWSMNHPFTRDRLANLNCETKPILAVEELPLEVTAPKITPEVASKPVGNRAFRRKQARHKATTGR